MVLRFLALFITVISIHPSRCLAQTRYEVTWLGNLGGTPAVSVPSAINDLGQIVGQSRTTSGALHGFLWDSGIMYDLGRLLGDSDSSSATDINNLGQVTGTTAGARGNDGIFRSQPYVWTRTTGWVDVGSFPLPPEYPRDAGRPHLLHGINDHGQMIGTFGSAHGASFDYQYPFLLESATWTYLGTLPYSKGASAVPSDINERGQIVGSSRTDSSGSVFSQAFIWEGGRINPLPFLIPGTKNSTALAINENSVVVGNSGALPMEWYNGVPTALPLPASELNGTAFSVNDIGQIVGETSPGLATDKHATLWSDGEVFNLNSITDLTAGGKLVSAVGINELGQIIGAGVSPIGSSEAFLLTPVPEPATALLALFAFIVVAFAWLRYGVNRSRRGVA